MCFHFSFRLFCSVFFGVRGSIEQPPAGAVPSAQCVVDVLDDHDGAVTAIAGDEEKLVSGSSDLSVKVKNT